MGDDRRWLRELSSRWWDYQRLAQGDRSQRKALELGEPVDVCAAADIVWDRIHVGGVEAIQLIAALIETAPNDASISYVGAGPLEDLVSAHGDSLTEDLDRLARQDPAFSRAMASVCLPAGTLSSGAERRLRKWIPV
jgi:hypothetical protein